MIPHQNLARFFCRHHKEAVSLVCALENGGVGHGFFAPRVVFFGDAPAFAVFKMQDAVGDFFSANRFGLPLCAAFDFCVLYGFRCNGVVIARKIILLLLDTEIVGHCDADEPHDKDKADPKHWVVGKDGKTPDNEEKDYIFYF